MTFDPDRWLEEGRANKHLLPDGVTLPEPEIDYEAWRPALRAYHTSRRWAHDPDVLTDNDKAIIRALIAAYEHAPKAATPGSKDGWIVHYGGPCPVAPTTRVDVEFRSGKHGRPGLQAGHWVWEYSVGCTYPYDIVAYRVAKED